MTGRPRHRARRATPLAMSAVALACAIPLGCTVVQPEVGASTEAMGLGTLPVAPPPPPPVVSRVLARIGSFRSPTRIAADEEGVLYISDSGRGQVALFDLEGERTGTLSGVARPLGVAVYHAPPGPSANLCELCLPDPPGRAVGRSRPQCLAVARGRGAAARNRFCHEVRLPPRTLAYVGDEADGSVQIFEDGEVVGALGAGAGEFGKPNAIWVTTDGIVHVVDSDAAAVMVYGLEGSYQGTYGGAALRYPTDLVIDEAAGRIFVSDFEAGNLAVFDLDGAWVGTLAAPANDRGDPVFTRPLGLGAAPGGRLLVVDNALGAVATLDGAGTLLDVIGYQNGRYWTGELALPIDAVSIGGRVYATSNRSGRVHVFEVTP